MSREGGMSRIRRQAGMDTSVFCRSEAFFFFFTLPFSSRIRILREASSVLTPSTTLFTVRTMLKKLCRTRHCPMDVTKMHT